MEGLLILIGLFIAYRLVSSFLRYKKDVDTTEGKIFAFKTQYDEDDFENTFMQGQRHHHLADRSFDRKKNLLLAIKHYEQAIKENSDNRAFYHEEEQKVISNQVVRERIRIAQDNVRIL